ncbi:3D-(3,5/4)-trihydroxycyclohexane-1,2-dione acylhydrolase (decyclizing) [Carnobacterium maltaromaticum]|jgi:3D-(3,5/4)-trihydroxycyclohexane-1,2-dione acylhydrolase (decyclizing)|uniref:3D-(3,5/4)-trihydroxycyclohexane-1,2-dione acylhydrolase (decyclizing) n=1 Tax=Carnobacterium maltaromaticum TaxID=2751 RepID=UPI000E767974|nr:3D-(3,5/4)-trihydroxycyclohexane-1,2-dione acylhydrolase (decyclizing) [Carnobacterium maltaromaticum]AOA02483.1 3D-(3,5/4)-trihydroxycyclohexane-1,2-dione acylhydrolase (decyclizing) [Carnobacterium maltaromaticum]MBC9789167.1 3D-(3,5/4)-trihydroxycyclohexane-1,2-dione acylhydrolase (decyclizing) [Carnobacterium maltaromaticum]MCI1818520.1 3D-(3,5/4)-trihydroxycyclohexane-1,2-dione acylhydrolase (decyclizing) [Carnobacterium maltaromaticum]
MKKTIRLTTAQALVRFLNQQYLSVDGKESLFVDGVFHIFGHGNVLGIGQALEQNPGSLKIIQGKNEQGIAQAAIAFSKEKLRRKIFAVTTSVGPGAANLVTAAGTALANNLPVLLLPGDTFASRQPDPVLQQIEQESSAGITTNDALKPVSRYWDRITRPEQVMSSLIRAFEVLTNPVTAGPVTICLAQDVEGEAYDYPAEFFNKRVHYLDRKAPTERELIGAIELIRNSKKPLIIVGGGAKYSDCREELMTISEKFGIPLVETQAGKSTVEAAFKNNLGGIGVTGTLAANKAAHVADLVIGVGTRYTDFTTGSKSIFANEEKQFLSINVSRMQAYKLDSFQVVADAKETLRLLLEQLEEYHAEFNHEIEALKKEWQMERQRLSQIEFKQQDFVPEISEQFTQDKLNDYAQSLKTELPQTTALLAINDFVQEDSIIVGAAGSLPGDLQRIWQPKKPNTYHVEYGYSCMGYEIAGTLGAKLAHPNQEVYAMIGDGSFHMLHSEFITSIQYQQKITILLFDNSGFGCINNLQMGNGSQSFGTEFRKPDDSLMKIDFAMVAAGYGAKSYTVRTLNELKAALEDAQKQTVSTLIDIKVLPKTMTDGYESWWNVGVAEVSEGNTTKSYYQKKQEMLKQARDY